MRRAALAIGVALVGCSGGDPGAATCPHGAANNNWSLRGLVSSVVLPTGCPYTLQAAGNWLDFAFSVEGPGANMGPDAVTDVRPAYFPSVHPYNAHVNAIVFQHPTDPTKKLVEFEGSYRAGQQLNGQGIRDTGIIHVAAAGVACCANSSEGGVSLPGLIDPNAPAIDGFRTVNPLQYYTWKAVVPTETTSYRYAWRVDGTLQSAATRSFTTYLVGGQPSITAIKIRTDQTRDSTTWTLKVLPQVSIQGPTEVRPTESCVWNAYVTGGTPPFQYAWRIDGTPIAGNSNVLSAQLSGSSALLDVTVTDALASTAYAQIGIGVHESHPECVM